MAQTFKNQKDAMAWQAQFDALTPKVGNIAPDFELSDVTGEQTVRLSSFRYKKPVALVFGSAT